MISGRARRLIQVSVRACEVLCRAFPAEFRKHFTQGLEPGQEIMVGPYQVIRNLKPGAKVKVDNRSGVELNKDE